MQSTYCFSKPCWLNPTAWLAYAILLFCMLAPPAMAASRLADFMPRINPAEIFPGADRLGPVEGTPPVARAYAGDQALGYVYITSDVVNTRGYSSFPIDTLIALSNEGTIVGAKLMEHHEPIVLIGIPISKVEHFISEYIGISYLGENAPRPGSPPPADIISGATVTLLVIGDSITRYAHSIIRHHRIGLPEGGAAEASSVQAARIIDMEKQDVADWNELLDSGAVSRMRLAIGQLNQAFAESGRPEAAQNPQPGEPDGTFPEDAWMDARNGWYVIHSRYAGGMGTIDALPFGTQEAAHAFQRREGGQIVRFEAIPEDYIFGLSESPDSAGLPAGAPQ